MVANTFEPISNLWLIVASALIFFMNAGFAMLETGFCRTGNAIGVLAKNLIVFCIATLAFWLLGFRFMLGDSPDSFLGEIGLLGQLGWGVDFPFPSANLPNPFPEGFEALSSGWVGRSFSVLFFFQLVFAGTAATIVSGAIAERIKFWAFLLFSLILVGLIYPLIGHWVWGGGWLASDSIQFRDFAGSAVVHSVGGMAALVGAAVIRPRQERFGYNVESNRFDLTEDPERFSAYSLSLATLGCLILWLGWFGFNGGSTTQLEYIGHILITTFFAAAAGGIGAVIFSPFVTDQKARLASIINGILGGLVGITACSAYVSANNALIIGAFSGLIVLWGEKLLIRLRIDDPVGAVPVHLLCGGWGTLSVGLFASPNASEYQLQNYSRLVQTGYQILGWFSICFTVAILSLVAWVGIGIILYILSPPSERIHRAQMKRISIRKVYGKSKQSEQLRQLIHISRHGLRVPLAMEETGGTPTLLP